MPSNWFEYLKSKEGLRYSIYDWRVLGNNSKCWYCGSDGKMTKDHFLPKSKKGVLKVWCCLECNYQKKDMTPKQWISYINLEIYRTKDVIKLSILHRMKKATQTLHSKIIEFNRK